MGESKESNGFSRYVSSLRTALARDLAIFLRVLWILVAIGCLGWLLQWYGFQIWSKRDVISLLDGFSWELLLSIIVIWMLVQFHLPITDLIYRFRKWKWGDFEAEHGPFDPKDNVEKRQETVVEDEGIVTIEEFMDLVAKVPGMDLTRLKAEGTTAHSWLLRNGVRTRSRLLDLVNSRAIWDFLRQVYVEELLRPREAPLDPVAVSTWGVTLLEYGLREEVKEYIVSRVRMSPEYKQKHRG